MESQGDNGPLRAWAQALQQHLAQAYDESASVFSQSSLIGKIREAVVRDILERFIPATAQVGTGQVMDSLGKLSSQVDIIIARGSAPAIRFDGNLAAFLYETVLATIEVKSMLYRDKLHESLDNSRSIKELSYLLHVRSKGPQVFYRAIDWIHSIGGLEELDKSLLEPSMDAAIDCPDEIWRLLHFVHFWLHWARGDFGRRETVQKLKSLTGNTEFDFFSNLLAATLGLSDTYQALTVEFRRAPEIETQFFKSLYEYTLYEHLPPDTFILAYGGYATLDKMVAEVKGWYEQNYREVEWWAMPRLILNHRMLMYRQFNEYHCNEFEYPVLFLINAMARTFDQDLAFSVSYGGTTALSRYFDLGRILGNQHPRHAPDYLLWTIPIDNSSVGEVRAMNKRSAKSEVEDDTRMADERATQLPQRRKRRRRRK